MLEIGRVYINFFKVVFSYFRVMFTVVNALSVAV